MQTAVEPMTFLSKAIEVKLIPLAELKHLKPLPGDTIYMDVRGLDDGARKKAMALLKKRCAGVAWGIIDAEGSIQDPSWLFFAGASDYLGRGVPISEITKARIKAVQEYFSGRGGTCAAARFDTSLAVPPVSSAIAGCASPKLEFPGWKAVRTGAIYPFYFLYISVSAQMNLKTRLGEAGYAAFRDRLRVQIQLNLAEAEPLLWMETDSSSLYLIPSKAANFRALVIACLRMLLWAPLIGYEKFGFPFPITFSFALHHGQTEFAPPGKTGTIVSDAVNFIYHLGVKRAEPGRLTISVDTSESAIPGTMSDLFSSTGSFEGRNLVQSRRFGS
jgi:hypothetical protein